MTTAKNLDDQNPTTEQAVKPSAEPARQILDVITSEQQPNGRIRWNKIGLAIPRRDGSYSLKLFMFPGWFVMKPRDPYPNQDPERQKLAAIPF